MSFFFALLDSGNKKKICELYFIKVYSLLNLTGICKQV